jgi:hypothetical protein
MLMFRPRARLDERTLRVEPRSLIERYETTPSFEVAAGLLALAAWGAIVGHLSGIL